MATSTARSRTRKTEVEESVSVEMEIDKETTRTIRYRENSDKPKIGVIYVPRETLTKLGDPATLTVTISV